MRKVFTFLLAVLLTTSVFAQSPEKMSYQAVIRDASDILVTNTQIGMQISILQGSTSGTAVYVETQTPTTNVNGLVSIEIGTGTTSDDFSAIDWANGPYFIKTETAVEVPLTTYTITGTSQLLSVPFALHAKTAESITNVYSIGDFDQGGVIFWVDKTGQHGLVAAKVDYDGGSGIQWCNGSYTNTEAHGDGVYAGEINTMLIIANQGSNSNDYAAGVCANYTVTESGATYGDWYLPSKEELNLMYQNKEVIDSTAGANGGSNFTNGYYWSSTEDGDVSAWGQFFDNGNQGASFKDDLISGGYVRAIRAF